VSTGGFKLVQAFYLEEGDRFKYGGDLYEALEDPRGEFNTIIRVLDVARERETELFIPDSHYVRMEQ
jgi:hypothetical protein